MIVVVLSVGLWAAALVIPGTVYWIHEDFCEVSWQLLFFGTLVLGFHAEALRPLVAWATRGPGLILLLALSVLALSAPAVTFGRRPVTAACSASDRG